MTSTPFKDLKAGAEFVFNGQRFIKTDRLSAEFKSNGKYLGFNPSSLVVQESATDETSQIKHMTSTELTIIENRFNTISRALFLINPGLEYSQLADELTALANEVNSYDGDSDELWEIGEGGHCYLADLITGAYWHYADWHKGQWSPEYAALSALGTVFSPGMAGGPEPESSEREVFDVMATMAAA